MIAPFGEVRDNWTFKQLRRISKKYGFTFATPVKDIPEEALNMILNGGSDAFPVSAHSTVHDYTFELAAEGITSGCGNGNYCPDDNVTRAQMAVFLVRTFGL